MGMIFATNLTWLGIIWIIKCRSGKVQKISTKTKLCNPSVPTVPYSQTWKSWGNLLAVGRWLKWFVPQPPGDASVFVRRTKYLPSCFQNAVWKCILNHSPNSLRNCGVDLNFQPWNGKASLDFLNIINRRCFCLNLQAIWRIILLGQIMWQRGWKLETAVQCRPLLAVHGCRLHVSSRADTLRS
jgi:hypothetical protein